MLKHTKIESHSQGVSIRRTCNSYMCESVGYNNKLYPFYIQFCIFLCI